MIWLICCIPSCPPLAFSHSRMQRASVFDCERHVRQKGVELGWSLPKNPGPRTTGPTRVRPGSGPGSVAIHAFHERQICARTGHQKSSFSHNKARGWSQNKKP
ncbi:hypothetical protein GGR56DRAFT_657071 [Xylariaceae sp. FL0804]|nr:hypothetical protein GGR56DRAFT_657071 [Xylariaceae sp. FL0804]